MTKAPTRGSVIDKGNKCPAGTYCVEGSSSGQQCPLGFFSSGEGLFAEADCNQCPDGYMCTTAGLSGAGLIECTAGYYCEEGTNENTKTKI
jgi:hypothetical protein